MEFDTHKVDVYDYLNAKFQLATFSLTWDFLTGSRVSQVFREISAFWVDHFFLRSHFTLKLVRIGWSTNLIDGAVNHFISRHCFDFLSSKKIVKKLKKVN